MTKAEIIAVIYNMPQKYKDTACCHIQHSNPVNDFVRNRAGACHNAGRGWTVYFSSRATKANMRNVLQAMLDEITVHCSIEEARSICPDYVPTWAAADEPHDELVQAVAAAILPGVEKAIKRAARRRKAYAADLQAMGLQWVDSYTVLNPRTGETGIRYELDKMPSDVQILQLTRWWNVIVSYGHHLHAPEIKRCSVVLLDQCPKRKPAGLQIYR